VGTQPTSEDDFYEEDEPAEKIHAAFDHGERGVTAHPPLKSHVTLSVDFNNAPRLFDAIQLGDEVWLDDGEGLRCRGTVSGVGMSQHVENCVLIRAKIIEGTFEDFENGQWIPRNTRR
jgi:hypothetical protein